MHGRLPAHLPPCSNQRGVKSEGTAKTQGEECDRRGWAIELVLAGDGGLEPSMMLGILTTKSYWTFSLLKWQVFMTKRDWKTFDYLRISRLDLELS